MPTTTSTSTSRDGIPFAIAPPARPRSRWSAAIATPSCASRPSRRSPRSWPRLAPADLVLIEGYKRAPHAKIEVRGGTGEAMAPADPNIVAIAADDRPDDVRLPWFRRDDVAAIADFIAARPL